MLSTVAAAQRQYMAKGGSGSGSGRNTPHLRTSPTLAATLMNKGLEVIEAHYLFGASYDDIEIVIHPQSIIHSMARSPLGVGKPGFWCCPKNEAKLRYISRLAGVSPPPPAAPELQVETADSSVLAQLGWPDMRLPILYTMSWPQRVYCSEETWPRLDFIKMGNLTFKCATAVIPGSGQPVVQRWPPLDAATAVACRSSCQCSSACACCCGWPL